ncbi:MAG: GNAT family N-acetyltransferase [Pirellulales bacterium]|nr:GNAT family N-acetyltransferase [Pirellulales bacterium]
MQPEVLDSRMLTEDDALAIGQLLSQVWPNPAKPVAVRKQQMLEMGRGYTGPDAQAPRSFLIREQGQIIAHAAIISRAIGTSAGKLTIAGLTRVCTALDVRGQGLGESVVRAVFEVIDAGAFPFSLFQTSDPVKAFYTKLGACAVDNPIVNSMGDDAQSSPFWNRIIMRYPSGGQWPDGTIDLRGPGY